MTRTIEKCTESYRNTSSLFYSQPRCLKGAAALSVASFKLVAELVASLAAMGSEGSGGKPFWSDHEITVDRDGIPHYTQVLHHP